MMIQSNTILVILVVAIFSFARGEDAPLVVKKGDLLFSDDFERSDLGENWKVVIPGFKVANGNLVGTQDRADHGAVGRVYVPMKDVVMSFRFLLPEGCTFNVVFDDKNFKGSHAGHICRVAVTPKQIRLGDDKEGIMRNDIFAMRKDPETRAKSEALLKGKGAVLKTAVSLDTWHTMVIKISGERMQVKLDDKTLGSLESPGIAHPTKESVHFTVNGDGILFDDVQIWAVETSAP